MEDFDDYSARGIRLLEEIVGITGLHPETPLRDLLAADSLTVVEWVFLMEEEFGRRYPDSDMASVNEDATVGDVIQVLVNALP